MLTNENSSRKVGAKGVEIVASQEPIKIWKNIDEEQKS